MSGNRMTAREFLAKKIRRAREAKGLSRDALAKTLYVSESLVAKWESCRGVPKPGIMPALEEALGTGGILTEILEDLVSGEVAPEWLGKWLQIEAGATSLLTFQPTVIPGILQTEEYARTVLGLGKPAPFDLEDQVRVRLERQKILERDDPPLIVVILGEAALRYPVGGEKVMAEQLARLVELAERPKIIVQVIPFGVGAHAGFAGSHEIASFDGRDFAYLDNALRGDVIEQTSDVSAVKQLWETLRAKALPERDSIDMIMEAARNYGMA